MWKIYLDDESHSSGVQRKLFTGWKEDQKAASCHLSMFRGWDQRHDQAAPAYCWC